jgi:integrase
MAKDTSVRLEFSEKLFRSIDFHQRVRGVDEVGNPITEKTPEGVKEWKLRDSKLQGWVARVYPGVKGAKASISHGVQRKMNIRLDGTKALKSASVKRSPGSWPELSVNAGRKRALEWLGKMAAGIDPAHEKAQDLRKQAEASEDKKSVFGKVYDDFVTKYSEGVKPATKKDREKVTKWLKDSPLWKKALSEVTHEVVEKTFDPLFQSALGKCEAPKWGPAKPDLSTAWKSFRYCSKAYHDAIARKTGGTFSRGSSAFGLVASTRNWPHPEPKENRLDVDEAGGKGQAWLKRLVELRDEGAPHVGVFADYILCSLIWGGRRRETQRLRWDDLDFNSLSGKFIAEHTKSGRDHVFPLTPWVVEILNERRERNKAWDRDGEWVFPSRQNGKPIAEHRVVLETLRDETGLWITSHDLRRTAASDTAGLTKSDSMLVSLTLAHSGGRQAITQSYIASARVKLLRPLFEARERKFRVLVGLSIPEPVQGPIDTLIEFLEAAKLDPLAVGPISKRAGNILELFDK